MTQLLQIDTLLLFQYCPMLLKDQQFSLPKYEFCYNQNDPYSLTITLKPDIISNICQTKPVIQPMADGFVWLNNDDLDLSEITQRFKNHKFSLQSMSSIKELKKYIKACEKQAISIICKSENVLQIYKNIKSHFKLDEKVDQNKKMEEGQTGQKEKKQDDPKGKQESQVKEDPKEKQEKKVKKSKKGKKGKKTKKFEQDPKVEEDRKFLNSKKVKSDGKIKKNKIFKQDFDGKQDGPKDKSDGPNGNYDQQKIKQTSKVKVKYIFYFVPSSDQEKIKQQIQQQIQEYHKLHPVKPYSDILQEITKISKPAGKQTQYQNFISLQTQIGQANQLVGVIFAIINQSFNRAQLWDQLNKLIHLMPEEEKNSSILQKLKQPLDIKSSINLYTKQSFLHSLLNQSFRSKGPTCIYILQPYICDLFKAIHRMYVEQKENQKGLQFKCYRGGSMIDRQISFLQSNINCIIQNSFFMSTSRKKQIAQNFLGNALIQIDVAYTECSSQLDFGFANIQNLSQYQEQEVLFNPLNTFKVCSVKLEGNFYHISLKHLVLDSVMRKDEKSLSDQELRLKALNSYQLSNKKKYQNIGTVLYQFNNIGGAEQYFDKFMQIALKSGNYEYICDGYLKRAKYYQKKGEFCGMQENFLQYFRLTEDRLRQDEQKYLKALINMCQMYIILDKRSEVYKYGFFLKKQTYFLQQYQNLSFIFSYLGDYERALNFSFAYKKYIQLDGKYSQVYANVLDNIAGYYLHLHQFQKAYDYQIQCRDIRKIILGDKHPDYSRSLNNLANIYCNMRDHNSALKYFSQALQIKKNILGDKHSGYATALNNVGKVYQIKGNLDLALQYFVEAKDIQKKTIGKTHRHYMETLMNIGSIYEALGNFDKSLQSYLQLQRIQKNILAELKQILPIKSNKIINRIQQIKNETIFNDIQQRQQHNKIINQNYLESAKVLSNIANVNIKLDKLYKALQCETEAANIRLSVLGQKHIDYANSLKIIAKIHEKLSNYDNALYFYMKVKSCFKKMHMNNGVGYANLLDEIAELQQREGEHQKALANLNESIQIYQKLLSQGEDGNESKKLKGCLEKAKNLLRSNMAQRKRKNTSIKLSQMIETLSYLDIIAS